MTKGRLFKSLLLFACLLFGTTKIKSQTFLDCTLGYGMPEQICLGMRLNLNPILIGVSAGSFPSNDYEIFTGSADIYLLFGDDNKKTRRPVWYVRGGGTYSNKNDDIVSYNRIYGNLRFGREFALGLYWSFNIDFGGSFLLYNKEKINVTPPSDWNGDENNIIGPGGCIYIFYRI